MSWFQLVIVCLFGGAAFGYGLFKTEAMMTGPDEAQKAAEDAVRTQLIGDTVTLEQNAREYLEELVCTQYEGDVDKAAEALGTLGWRVEGILDGKDTITLAEIVRIADHEGVSIDDVIGR